MSGEMHTVSRGPLRVVAFEPDAGAVDDSSGGAAEQQTPCREGAAHPDCGLFWDEHHIVEGVRVEQRWHNACADPRYQTIRGG